MQTTILIFMIIGGIAIIAFCIPPLISLIKTHRTDNINLPMFCVYVLAELLLIIQAIGQAVAAPDSRSLSIPLAICNILCLVISVIILVLKIKGLVKAMRNNMTERVYWDNIANQQSQQKTK